ncbi:MAG: tRNA (adenosine(37)-N6)-threonylcarbamoyltransferase complex dimerization subunit type 1 TsaB [Candidatus Methylomirabilia bacterium]
MKKTPALHPTGLVLGIETATAVGGVALVSADGELLGEITLRNHESHSERILPAADWLLKTLGVTLRDCAAVAVSQGPGSFTGLRAGIATAKGLAFSLGVPLFGIPTLAALAANAPPGTAAVCAVLNARRGEIFHALFRHGPTGQRRLGPDSLAPLRAFAEGLPADCLVVGELPASFGAMLPPGRVVRFAPPHLGHPRAAVVAALGSVAHGAARASCLTTLMPLYLRPCDAVAGRAGR